MLSFLIMQESKNLKFLMKILKKINQFLIQKFLNNLTIVFRVNES